MVSELAVRGRRTRIRPASQGDLSDLLEARGNTRYWRESGFAGREHYELLLRLTVAAPPPRANCNSVLWVLEELGGAIFGMAYLARTVPWQADGLAGVFIEDDRGSGLATEAIALCFYLAFHRMGLRYVSSPVRPDNPRAVRFWMKIGLRAEGVLDAGTDRPPDAPPVELAMGITAQEFAASDLARGVLEPLGLTP